MAPSVVIGNRKFQGSSIFLEEYRTGVPSLDNTKRQRIESQYRLYRVGIVKFSLGLSIKL